jgi:hypothetical protein
MSNTVSVAETANSVVVVEADNTVTVTEADNTVIVTAPSNLPFGGATDDLLVKQSATDGDVAWQDEITVDQIDFDTTAAETLTTAGQMAWDADVDTIDVLLRNGTATPTLMHIGQDEYFYVKASAAITRGQVVHYTGTDGNSGHILAAPFLADGTYESKTVIGVATQDADTGEFVHVLWRGKLRSFDTSLLTPGILYASTTVAGGFQSTAPTAPDNIVTVAVAVNQKSNGTLLVRPTFAGSLAESEDVDVSAPSDGDVLTYSSSTGVWESSSTSPGGILAVTVREGHFLFTYQTITQWPAEFAVTFTAPSSGSVLMSVQMLTKSSAGRFQWQGLGTTDLYGPLQYVSTTPVDDSHSRNLITRIDGLVPGQSYSLVPSSGRWATGTAYFYGGAFTGQNYDVPYVAVAYGVPS